MRKLVVFGAALMMTGLGAGTAMASTPQSLGLLPANGSSTCPASAGDMVSQSKIDTLRQRLSNGGFGTDKVDAWGGCIQVFQTADNGSQSMVYFNGSDPLFVD